MNNINVKVSYKRNPKDMLNYKESLINSLASSGVSSSVVSEILFGDSKTLDDLLSKNSASLGTYGVSVLCGGVRSAIGVIKQTRRDFQSSLTQKELIK